MHPTSRKSSMFASACQAVALVIPALLAMGSLPASAQNLVWVGNDSNNTSNFSNSGNWQSNTLPSWGYANSLKFNQNQNSNVTGLNYDWGNWRQVNDIYWDSTFNVSRTLTASNGGGIDFKTRIENNSSSTQTVTMNLSGGKDGASDIQLNPVKGSLILSGTIFNDNSLDYVVWGSDTGSVTNLTLNTELGPNAGTKSNVDFTVAGGRSTAVQVNASQSWAGTTTVNSGIMTAANGVTLASTAIVVGGGTVATTSANTLADTATLTVNSGRLSIGGSDTVASLAGSGGTVDITSGATLTAGNAGSTSYAGSITGSGGFTKVGSGAMTLSGNNSYGGGTLVSQGTLVGNASTSFGSGSIVLGDGNTGTSSIVLMANTTDTTNIANAITVANLGTGLVSIGGTNTGAVSANAWNGTLTLNRNVQVFNDTPNAGGRTSFLGQITGSGGITVTQGRGRVTLQNTTNNFTGPVVVDSGATLQLDVATNTNEVIPNSAAVTVNGALNFASGGGTETIGSLAGSGTVSSVIAGTYSLVVGGSANTTFSGAINNGSGVIGLTQSGSGTLTLTGNNTYTGNTTITNGGTQILNSASFGSGARNYVVSSNSVLVLNATSSITAASGSSSISGAGTLRVTNGLLSTTNNSILTLAMGPGGLINVAAGATVRNGAHKNINWTNNQASMMLDGAVDMWDGQDIFIDALNGSGAVMTSDQYRGNINFTLGVANGSGTFTGQLTAPNLSVIKSGTGTQILAGTNTYTNSTTISGGTLVISGLLGNGSYAAGITNNASLVFGNSGSQTLSGAISGSGSFTMAGAGRTTLSQANSYSGGTLVSQGALVGGASTSFGSGSIVLGDGNSGTSSIVLMANNSGGTTIANAITVANLGTGLVSIGGTNTGASSANAWTGTLTLNRNVQVFGDTTPGSSGRTSFLGQITGSGGITVTQGRVTLQNGTNNFTGPVVVNSGATLQLDVATGLNEVIPNSAAVTVNGLLNFASGGGTETIGSLAGSGTVSSFVAGTYSLVVGGSTSTTFSGVITNGSGVIGLTKSGNGTLTLSGSNSYTGGTIVSAGQLVGTTASLQGAITNNASVAFDQATTGNYGSLMSGSGSLTKLGVGTVKITGSNSYSGGTTITGGTVEVSAGSSAGGSAAGLGTGTVSIGSGAQLTYYLSTTGSHTISNAFSLSGGTLYSEDGNNNFAGLVTLASGTSTISSRYEDTIRLSGGLAGSGDVLFTQAGGFGDGPTYVLSGTGANTGTVRVSGSSNGRITKLQVANVNALQSATLDMAAGDLGTVEFTVAGTNTYSLGGLQGTRSLAIGGNSLSVGGNNQSTTYTGTLSGSGLLTKVGNGTLTLSGSNSHTGGTIVSAGQLVGTAASLQGAITNNAAVEFAQATSGTYAGSMTGSGSLAKTGTGTMTLSGSNAYAGGSIVSAGRLVGTTTSLQGAITNNAAVEFAQATSGTYAGSMTGSGSLTKSGAGTLLLTGSNGFTGGAALNAGTLGVGSANALGSSGAISFGGGTLQYSASNTTDYSGRFSNAASQQYSIDTNGQNVTLGSNLTSSGGSFTKLGAGDVTLSGNNSYGGGTVVSAGRLVGTTASLQGAITNNAAVEFAQATSGTYAGSMTGSGSLTKTGAGTMTLSGSNAYAGGTIVSAGQLVGTTASLQGAITNNASVAFDQATTGNYSSLMSGSGSLTKLGVGTVWITGSNSYSGGTTVTGGIVGVSAGGSVGGSAAGLGTGTVSIASGGQVTYYLSIAGTHTIANAFSLSGGTLYSEDGNNNFAGLVTLASGASTISSRYQDTITLSGGLAGSGDVLLTQAGGLGDGPTYVLPSAGSNTGTVRVSGSSNGRTTKLQVANVNALQSATLDMAAGDLGTVEFTVAGTNTYSLGGLQGARSLAFGGNSLSVGGNNQSTTYSGTLSGSGGFSKVGNGTLTLSGSNSTSGGTTVSAGGLKLNGSIAGGLNVAAIATLSGTGTIGGNATIAGTHSPGNSPGVQTFNGNLTYQAGAVVNWELIANTTGSAGVNYDQIIMPTGNLTFSGSTTLALAFNSPGSTVDWSNAFWNVNRAWTVYDLSGGSTGSLSNLIVGGSLLDSVGNPLSPTERGYFTTSLSGQDVMLNFVAVPEPSTSCLALAGLAAGGFMIRRSRQRRGGAAL